MAVKLCDTVMRPFPLNGYLPSFSKDSSVRLKKQTGGTRFKAQNFKIHQGHLSKASQATSNCCEGWDTSGALPAIWQRYSKAAAFMSCQPCWCALFRWCSCFWVIHISINNSSPYSVSNSTNSLDLLGWNLSLNCCQCPFSSKYMLALVSPVKDTNKDCPFFKSHVSCGFI